MERFKDQVVFITGGTSGIGLATAVQFAATDAAHIIVCGRTETKWISAQNYIQSLLQPDQIKKIEYWPCDVRIEAQVKAIIDKVFTKYGRLDVCFNNAGVQPGNVVSGGEVENLDFDSRIDADGSITYSLAPPQPGSGTPDAGWEAAASSQYSPASEYRESPISTSIFGVFYCLKWEIAYAFKKQPKNLPFSIISTSSRNGIIPDSHRPLYAGAKAFIIAVSKSLSNQVAQRSVKEGRAMVRINVVAPGPVDTPLERGAFPGSDAEFNAKAALGVPMQRVATPEEIAPAVLFLADPTVSGYITGAILPVDGGDVASPFMSAPA